MKRLATILAINFIFVIVLKAQPLLTPEDAVNIALKNNYDILVARSNADIDKANNTLGNAGMLPIIGASGSGNVSQVSTRKELASGVDSSTFNSITKSVNAAVSLSWTLFDGGKMFITKNKLNEIEALGELQFKDTVMQSVYNVVAAYYNVVSQKQQLAAINEVIIYNTDLVKILQTSFNAGLIAKTGLLQAQIDLNVYKENAIIQQSAILSGKRALNQILSRDAATNFEVSDSIPFGKSIDKNLLVQKLDSTNISILEMQKNVEISRLAVKEFSTMRYPKITLNSAYNISQTNNNFGFLLQNNSYGPNIGATISIPIFQAGNINRQVSVAKLQYQQALYGFQNLKLGINLQMQNVLTLYDNQLQLLKIEIGNVALAKENMEISIQRLRLGQTTILEVRQAEDSYEQSRTRLTNFEYNLKIAETKLKQLISDL
jgi:outer membrane protein TolC